LQSSENFAELLKTADVHLVPQRAEAADLVLPSKLGGIFASGKPVIAMAKAGTGLALEIGNAGIVIPPGDVQALIGAVRALADDPSLCSALGKGARSVALSRWDKTTILTAVEQMLTASTEAAADLTTGASKDLAAARRRGAF
jgi:colanic acid biosynthesis glycosyl transferase WcaI